jgi:hypothetical protein
MGRPGRAGRAGRVGQAGQAAPPTDLFTRSCASATSRARGGPASEPPPPLPPGSAATSWHDVAESPGLEPLPPALPPPPPPRAGFPCASPPAEPPPGCCAAPAAVARRKERTRSPLRRTLAASAWKLRMYACAVSRSSRISSACLTCPLPRAFWHSLTAHSRKAMVDSKDTDLGKDLGWWCGGGERAMVWCVGSAVQGGCWPAGPPARQPQAGCSTAARRQSFAARHHARTCPRAAA